VSAALQFAMRNVNQGVLRGLDLSSTKVHALAGAVAERRGEADARLTQLKPMTGVKPNSMICFYEHIATVFDRIAKQYYVAFRETEDALLARSQDPTLYPEWLMKSLEKQAEAQIYIYRVKQPPLLNMISIEEWLEPIGSPSTFDTLAYFLVQNGVLKPEMFTQV
jgi:hypothetical protein